MVTNPFELIDSRLSNIESLLLDLRCGPIVDQKPLKLPELLTKQEAADYLKVSSSTIDNYRRTGILKAEIFGNHVRFRVSELEKLVSNNEKSTI
jgi:excisionase family DNA binding protein